MPHPLAKACSELTLIGLTTLVRNTASPPRKRGIHWIGIASNIGVRWNRRRYLAGKAVGANAEAETLMFHPCMRIAAV